MNDEQLHRHLVGRQGSRRDLNTPVLVIDRDALDRNIARMKEFASANGLKLRPHAKTHKSADIAHRQLAADRAAGAPRDRGPGEDVPYLVRDLEVLACREDEGADCRTLRTDLAVRWA